MTLDQFQGCMLGLALGDALGAPLEGGPLERLLWRVIGRTRQGEMRWTDDTQMSLDVAESLAEKGCIDPNDLAQRFARSYHWSRGYGPGAAKLLKRIARGTDWREANRSVYSEGSYGNGGAMRAPVIGIYYVSRFDELADAARLSASVTHAHPLGMEGAVLVAASSALALHGGDPLDVLDEASKLCTAETFATRLTVAKLWLHSVVPVTPKDVRAQLGNGIAASESCVTAIYIALRFMKSPFLEMMQFAASCRGDVDTIGAMSGAIWGAANGSAGLPRDRLAKLEQRERIAEVAAALFQARIGHPISKMRDVELSRQAVSDRPKCAGEGAPTIRLIVNGPILTGHSLRDSYV